MPERLADPGTMRGRAVGSVALPGGRGITLYAVRPVAILLAATPDADRLAAMAARQCYSAGSILDLPQPLSPKSIPSWRTCAPRSSGRSQQSRSGRSAWRSHSGATG